MKLYSKLIGVIVGTIILGLGIAMFQVSSLGFDGLSYIVIGIQHLLKTSYSIAYIVLNFLFFILMLILLRTQIGIGTIINFVLTGVFADIFMYLFRLIGFIQSSFLIFNILFGIVGILFLSFGIALYANANLGVTPYDSLALIITKYIKMFNKPIKYHIARKITDGSCIILGFILGTLIFKQKDLFGLNTIISFVLVGYVVSCFSKFINKYIYKSTNEMFK